MVKVYSSEDLREMSLTELTKHAQKLKKANYNIGCYSKLRSEPQDLKKFRALIRKAYKAGPQTSPTLRKDCSRESSTKKSKKRSTKKRSTKKRSTKKRSTKKRSTKKSSKCNPQFKNKTECVKHTNKDVVRTMAEDCGLDVDNLTKIQQCEALFNDIQKGKPGSGFNKNPYKDEEYFKNLMKNNTADQLRKKATNRKIEYVMQDDKNITVSKARKESIAIALYELKNKKKPSKDDDSNDDDVPLKPSPKKKPSSKKDKYTKDNLSEMSESELRKILKKHGIKKGVSKQNKDILIQYVLAAQENDKCDPVKDEMCKGDLVCDASNTPGVCISKDYVGHHSMDIWNYKGHQIIGSKDPIQALKKKLKPKLSEKDKYRKKKIIKQIIKINNKDKSEYDFYTLEEVKKELEQLESEDESSEDESSDSEDEKPSKDESSDDDGEKTELINAILYYTGENLKERSKYEKYTIEQLNKIISGENIDGENPNRYTMTKFIITVLDVDSNDLRKFNEDYITELYKTAMAKDDDDDSDDKPLETPKDDDKSSDDDSSDEEDSDDSSDEEDSDEEKPSEGTEIPDMESALSEAIAGSKIGNMTKTMRSVVKCLGLMSSK